MTVEHANSLSDIIHKENNYLETYICWIFTPLFEVIVPVVNTISRKVTISRFGDKGVMLFRLW